MRVALDQVVRLPLAPLLVAQAMGVRRRAKILTEPHGAREGCAGSGTSLRLLILGDSSAAGVGAGTQEAALSGQLVAALSPDFAVRWRLIGETSATTGVILKRLAAVETTPFDVVVSALGVNDVTRGNRRGLWQKQQRQLAKVLTKRFGAKLIVASGLPPMGAYPELPQPLRWVIGQQAQRLDSALADVCDGHSAMTHLPIDVPFESRFLAEDGYHPSEAAYTLWGQLIAAHIRRHFKG
ncbi:MAG: SGNH/GDSL hydrolase family protein [Shimia sp.]|uniref:SGNH/GDSL hydrolase family protein n=1 Tax=Shimia sp. TaxID=1954381 RepID=UPI003B8CAC08